MFVHSIYHLFTDSVKIVEVHTKATEKNILIHTYDKILKSSLYTGMFNIYPYNFTSHKFCSIYLFLVTLFSIFPSCVRKLSSLNKVRFKSLLLSPKRQSIA